MIFIISIIFNNQKYFEKLTIIKKNNKSLPVRWSIDEAQLYLLSRFPIFRGVKGLVPKADHHLPNFSGALGSYGFLSEPGDFSFVSAPELDSFWGGENRLSSKDFGEIISRNRYKSNQVFPYPSFFFDEPFFREHFRVCFGGPPEWEEMNELFHAMRFLGANYHCAANTHDFARKYLRFGIGEPIFMKNGQYNTVVRDFLSRILSNLRTKASKSKNDKEKN